MGHGLDDATRVEKKRELAKFELELAKLGGDALDIADKRSAWQALLPAHVLAPQAREAGVEAGREVRSAELKSFWQELMQLFRPHSRKHSPSLTTGSAKPYRESLPSSCASPSYSSPEQQTTPRSFSSSWESLDLKPGFRQLPWASSTAYSRLSASHAPRPGSGSESSISEFSPGGTDQNHHHVGLVNRRVVAPKYTVFP
mmetsp:Transcript_55524/g.120978  ORF Transcript_55524/g.120978 Transcript_55524/m.120978 type:complete len:200 (+) Transcript_55524:216-815(+)